MKDYYRVIPQCNITILLNFSAFGCKPLFCSKRQFVEEADIYLLLKKQ